MGKVCIDLSMSLDGFITGPHPDPKNGLGRGGLPLHDWYFNGDTPSPHNEWFKPGKGSEALVEEMFTTTGAIVVGRKWYDIVNGWDGNHPIPGVTIVVLTHEVPEDAPQGESRIVFVTDGIESAVATAQKYAGDKTVSVGGAGIAQQCLNAGLVDEMLVHIAPILLGDGVRLFERLDHTPITLEQTELIAAEGTTHLRFRVVK